MSRFCFSVGVGVGVVLVGFGLRESGVGAAGSCFKLSFPEMFEGTSRVLSVPVTLKW